MKTCVKITGYIRRVMFMISGVFIACATALAALNALLRFFGLGLGWADEMYVYFIVLMVYIALPQLEGTGDQLCITAIDSWVKNPIGQRILNYIRGIITSFAVEESGIADHAEHLPGLTGCFKGLCHSCSCRKAFCMGSSCCACLSP